MGLANQTPHRDEWGARSEWKNPRAIPNDTHYFTFSLRISHSWQFGAGDTYLPTDIRIAAVLYESTPASLHIITYNYISMSYGPNLTNKFAIPHVCLYHVYVLTVYTQLPEWTIQYSWRYARHDQSNRAIRTQPYQSNGDTFDTNPLRNIQTTFNTYPPVPSVQNVLLGSLSNPKNCHLGIKNAESAIPHRIFWILWKMAYTLSRETEMTVADMGLVLCAAAALEIEEEGNKTKKKRKKKR